MSFELHLFAPIYNDAYVASDGLITTSSGAELSVRVLDQTRGTNTAGGHIEFQTMQPSANVRMSDLVGLDIPEEIPGGQLELNGRTWTIQSYRYAPVPDAAILEGGELTLLLIGTGE